MKCPFCGYLEDKVVDSRESREGDAIRRRRECLRCERRFTSYERIDEIPYMVVKKDGRRETFDRVGRLDERYEIGMFEDDDYALRLAAAGLRLAVARDSFVHHAGRGSFRAFRYDRTALDTPKDQLAPLDIDLLRFIAGIEPYPSHHVVRGIVAPPRPVLPGARW